MKPKVSIIVPIYNTAKYLPKCLDSIVNQTYHNLEIILVNDGSTDNSSQIIQQYAKKDSRIQIINQKNAGQSAARNSGIQKATGKYISFIDSDDEIAHVFIDHLMKPFLSNSYTSLSVCGLRYRWLKTNTKQDVFLKPLRPKRAHESRAAYILFLLAVDGRMYSSFNKIYKKEYLKNARFNQGLNFAEDTKFVLDYLKNTPDNTTISFILEPLCYYNYGTNTSTLQKTAIKWSNWQKSYQNLKNWVGPKPSLSERFWLFAIHCRWRISYLRAKKRTQL